MEFLTAHEDFIFPRYRQKQVLEFLKDPLNDLCISRPKERLEWGIQLPFDGNYVTYVWFDALLNYYSAVADKPGCGRQRGTSSARTFWFHPTRSIWPIMLHAAGLPLPGGIIAHGWWMQSGSKMSKSTGNALNPLDLVAEFGADAFRYFLIREMNVGQDSDFTREQFLVRYNSELANNLGNLVNRTLNMTTRFASGVLPAAEVEEDLERSLRDLWNKTRDEFIPLCEGFQFHTALERAMFFLTETNAYIEKRAPWKLGKSTEAKDQALLRTSLATMAEALRLAVALISNGDAGGIRRKSTPSSAIRRAPSGGRAGLGHKVERSESRTGFGAFSPVRLQLKSRRRNRENPAGQSDRERHAGIA